MKGKLNMRLLSSDLIAIGTASVIITVFSALFYFDINKKVDAKGSEVIGSITYKKHSASRKYSSQVVWEDIEQQAPVYNNDTIRTAGLSEVVIHLSDGTDISLNESSMILVSLGSDQINVEFSHGSMSTKRGALKSNRVKKMNIKSGGSMVSVRKSDVQLKHTKDRELDLTVNRGDAKILSGKNEKIAGVNQRVVVSGKSDEVKIYTLKLKPLSPAPDTYFASSSGRKKINFAWEPVKGKYDIFFQLSVDDSFEKPLKNIKMSKTKFEAILNSGTYYWRLKSKNRSNRRIDYGSIRKFTLLDNRSVIQSAPLNHSVIKYRKSLPIIDFRWSKGETSSSYRLQISKDKLMKKIFHELETPENHLAIDNLLAGKYYWRVDSVVEFGGFSHVSHSRVNSFEVDKKKKVESPELIYPPENKKICRQIIINKPFSFTWKGNQEIKSSRFEISKNKDFKETVFSEINRSDFTGLSEVLSTGKYYWRVTGILEEGVETVPSNIRSFLVVKPQQVKLISPDNKKIIVPDKNDYLPSSVFSWGRANMDTKFHIQLARDDDFDNIYREAVTNNYIQKFDRLEPGTYYWRVNLLDDSGAVLLNGKSRKIRVLGRLPVPKPVYPSAETSIDMSKINSFRINWKEIKEADKYNVKLYKVAFGRSKKIFDKKTSSDSVLVNRLNKLSEGKFYWTIEAFDIINNKVIRKSGYKKSYFYITLKNSVKKPEISSIKIKNLE